MRILGLTNLYPHPCQPGRAPYNRLTFRALASRHPVGVIAPVAWTDRLARRLRGLACPARSVQDGIPVEYPVYYFPPRVLRGWYGQCLRESVRATFTRAVAALAPDVVYASWAYPDGWAAVELAHQFGLPAVVSVHGSDVRTVPIKSAKFRQTIDGLRRADAVIAVSRDLANRILLFGVDAARVHVICTGVDPDLFHWQPPEAARQRLGLGKEPLIVAVGNLVPVKGFDLLIAACAQLAAAGTPFRCAVIGHGPLRAALERQATSAGLDGRFRLLGALPQEQLPDWYRAATVVALPSRSEGVPSVQLETAACGTPLVAARVGGIPEFAHLGRCTLVPPENVDELACALAAALADPGPRTPPAPESCRDVADVATEMERLFESVAKPQARVRTQRQRLRVSA